VKFRDEIRPRFGLMRGREFLMKDAYSFHTDASDCEREYRNMADAYTRIFRRCGLETRQVESDTGAIGGERAHEFHVLAESGEDAIVSCGRCSYAANVEKASGRPRPLPAAADGKLAKVHTPGQRTVREVAAFLSLPPERFIKTLLYITDRGPAVAALVRGDHDLSEVKLRNAVAADAVVLADEGTVAKVTGAPVGFAGPIGLKVHIVADAALRGIRGAVTGANEPDHHLVNVDQERDLPKVEFADLRVAQAGDGCPRCDGVLESHRGIEVGNIFYLGTKYSVPMGATYLDAEGQARPIVMGCYGIGITRTAAAAIEQHHDGDGILWPVSLAPAHVYLMPVNVKDARLVETSEKLYRELRDAGLEVLLDDREERPGVKFKDADLLGLPLRLTVGAKSLERGQVEWKPRRQREATEVLVTEVVGKAAQFVRDHMPS
jgi:prolyl-tRNA synthetase